ncbi:MAG: OB-fold nucleic acid binding domain-containing protein [Acidobacteriota bacterium]
MRSVPSGARSWLRPIVASTLVLLAISCSGLLATRIGEIKANPDRYNGRHVKVAGQVTRAVNMVFVKYFIVKDRTGQIAVVTEGELPKEGDSIAVRGRVNRAFAIGSTVLQVIVEDSARD